jgi:hypothetical protein
MHTGLDEACRANDRNSDREGVAAALTARGVAALRYSLA